MTYFMSWGTQGTLGTLASFSVCYSLSAVSSSITPSAFDQMGAPILVEALDPCLSSQGFPGLRWWAQDRFYFL